MSVICFVDTNLLVYARDAKEASKQPLAEAWLAALWATSTMTYAQFCLASVLTACLGLRGLVGARCRQQEPSGLTGKSMPGDQRGGSGA